MANIDHHLQQHGKGWRARMEIPAELRSLFGGQRHFIRAFGEVTKPQARTLRDHAIAEWQFLIRQARNADDPLIAKARILQRRVADTINQTFELHDDPKMEAAYLADEVEARDGPEASERLFAMMHGFQTALDEYFEEFLADENFNGKVRLMHRSAFKELQAYCKEKKLTTLQAITRRDVWDFIDKRLRPGSALKTVNRKLSTYRTYWRWLMRRSRAESNPWLETTIGKKNKSHVRAEDTGKAPFKDEQVKALLSGKAPGALNDLMMIGALTGARIDAICGLRVRDCTDQTFTFMRAKLEPHDRTIPIHSKLKSIVAKRMKGKGPDALLFHELPDATPTRPRSASSSQAFTRYRRALGIGGKKGEASRYDFHSFRRWFTTKAEQAGQPPHIIDFVTGHKRPGETLGRYSEGPSMKQMLRCVEAVTLAGNH